MIHYNVRVAVLAVFAIGFLALSPKIAADGCDCAKPTVKISLGKVVIPEVLSVQLMFGKLGGNPVAVPPDDDGQELEPEEEYEITLNVVGREYLQASDEVSGSVGEAVVYFSHCSLQYSVDGGDNWSNGSTANFTLMPISNNKPTNPERILIRLTDAASDSGNSSELGSNLNITPSGPSYEYLETDPMTPKPPALGLEIPLGSILAVDGHRSAGKLVNYGVVGSSFASPANLRYNRIEEVKDLVTATVNDTQRLYTVGQGVIRVRGWDAAAGVDMDIRNAQGVFAQSTLVEFYHTENYPGTPHSFTRIESIPSGVRIVKSIHGVVTSRTFETGINGETLVDTWGDRVTTTTRAPLPGVGWMSTVIQARNNVPVSEVREDYELRGFFGYDRKGPRYVVTSRIEKASDAESLVTEYTYFSDGRLEKVSRPDGSWTSYDAVDQNVQYSPWLSFPAAEKMVKTVQITEDKSFWKKSRTQTESYLVEGTVETKLSDTSTERSKYVTDGADADDDLSIHAVMRDGIMIQSYTLSYSERKPGYFLTGRTIMTWDDTGKATRYDYSIDDLTDLITVMATTGHIANPSSASGPSDFSTVPEHSTREITVNGPHGVLLEETQVCGPGNTFSTALEKNYEYEPAGAHRLLAVKVNGITISKNEYDTTAQTFITRTYDQSGAYTETEVDGYGEVLRSTTSGDATVPPITTTYEHSGLTSTTRVNGQVVAVQTRDMAGRTVGTQDAIGAVTETTYSEGGRIVTATGPAGITTIQTRHHDGRPVSSTGSGAVAQFYTYDVVSGRQTTRVTIGDPDGPRRTTTTQHSDGSTASVETPAPAGGGTVTQSYHYAPYSSALLRVSSSAANSADQVQLDPASSPIAALGHYQLRGYETDSNGPVPASSDRLTETSISYINENGAWHRRTVTKVFTNADSTAARTHTTLEALAPESATVNNKSALRWSSKSTEGSRTILTTTDYVFDSAEVITTTDDSSTEALPDFVTVTRHGREVSRRSFDAENPETMEYDASGRLVKHTSQTGAITINNYNTAGQLESVLDHAGKLTSYTYCPADGVAAGRLFTTTLPKGGQTVLLYNTFGQITGSSGTGTYKVMYTYNEYGEQTEMKTYQDEQSTGDLTTWDYDPATGLLTGKTDADNKRVAYSYDANGRLITRTWPGTGAATTTYSHNAFGDLVSTSYSDNTPSVSIVRDRIGRATQITDGSGTRTLNYMAAGDSLDSVEYDSNSLLPGLTVDYTADEMLRPTGYSVPNNGPIASRIYDDYGRLLEVAADGSVYHYGYVAGTNLQNSLTIQSGSNPVMSRNSIHDPMLRLTSISNTRTSDGNTVTYSRHDYTLDGDGRRTAAARENGQSWQYGYDSIGQVTSAVKSFAGGGAMPAHTFSYIYDDIGNRKSAVQGGSDTLVTYNANSLNQYDSIATAGGRFVIGEAPAADEVLVNGQAVQRANGGTFFWKQFTGDNANGPLWSEDTTTSNQKTVAGHLWTPAASVTPEYDANGNLLADGRWVYHWDAENRLIAMETAAAAVAAGVPRQLLEFAYDAQFRRISKKVSTSTDGTTWTLASDTRFLYDDWNLIGEYSMTINGLILKATHLWGSDLSGSPQGAGGVGGLLCTSLEDDGVKKSYHPAYDGNGNISAWVSATGLLISRTEYSPFGQVIARHKLTLASDDTHERLAFGFSTKYTDGETGLLYYGFRYYDPVTGRWPSRDPIEEAGGINLYGFVINSPMNWVDVLGGFPYFNPGQNPAGGSEGGDNAQSSSSSKDSESYPCTCENDLGRYKNMTFTLATTTMVDTYELKDPARQLADLIVGKIKKHTEGELDRRAAGSIWLDVKKGVKTITGTLETYTNALGAKLEFETGITVMSISMEVAFELCVKESGKFKYKKDDAFGLIDLGPTGLSFANKVQKQQIPQAYIDAMIDAANQVAKKVKESRNLQ